MSDGTVKENIHSDLEGLDLVTLDLMRSKLMGDRQSFDELSEEEIERWLAINARLRLAGRVASKPAANGGRKRAASGVAAQQSLSDLMSQVKVKKEVPLITLPSEDEVVQSESENE